MTREVLMKRMYLPPELLHGTLGVVLSDVESEGRGLVEGSSGLGVPAPLVRPRAGCSECWSNKSRVSKLF